MTGEINSFIAKASKRKGPSSQRHARYLRETRTFDNADWGGGWLEGIRQLSVGLEGQKDSSSRGWQKINRKDDF